MVSLLEALSNRNDCFVLLLYPRTHQRPSKGGSGSGDGTHFALSFRYALDGFKNSAGICANNGTMLGAKRPPMSLVFERWANTAANSGWALTYFFRIDQRAVL